MNGSQIRLEVVSRVQPVMAPAGSPFCECGFFMWNTCVTLVLVQKLQGFQAYQGFSMLFQLDRCEAKFWCSITRVLLEGFGVFRTLPNGVWAQEAAFFSVPPAGFLYFTTAVAGSIGFQLGFKSLEDFLTCMFSIFQFCAGAGLAPPPELQGQAFSFEAVAASLKSCGRTSAWNKPTAVLGLKAKGSKDVILLGKATLCIIFSLSFLSAADYFSRKVPGLQFHALTRRAAAAFSGCPMAAPPTAMAIPYPLETVPSLEVSEVEDSSIVLQAIKGLHDSLTAQLDQLDAKVQRLADERPAHFLRRRSSTPALLKSKSQAQAARGKDGLAMQVLQMDISHSGAPVSSRSLKSSMSLRGRLETHHTTRPATSEGPIAEKVNVEHALGIVPHATPLGAAELPGAAEDAAQLDAADGTGTNREVLDTLTDSVAVAGHEFTGAVQQDSTDVKESTTFSKDEETIPQQEPSRTHHAARAQNSSGNLGAPPKKSRACSVNSVGSLRASRGSSERLEKAVNNGNLSEVFKVREAELTATLSNRRSDTQSPVEERSKGRTASKSANTLQEITNEDAASVEEEEVYDSDSWSSWWLNLHRLNIFVACYASKALGLIPLFEIGFEMDWKSQCRRLVSRLYHWLLILFLLCAVIYSVMRFGHCRMREVVLDGELHAEAHWPALAVDIFLFLGASMVLSSWGGFKSYQATTELLETSLGELTSYCQQHGLATAWRIWSCSDAVWGLLLWFALLLGRFAVFTWNVWHVGGWWWGSLPFVAAYSLGTGVLVVASFWQVRTSHAMLLIVNSWSASVLRRDFSCIRSKHEWKRISGLFRKTSRAFERCFSALGITIVMLILSALIDLSHRWDEEIFATLAVALFLPGVLWTNASTTTACNRLPSLVMLLEADDEEEDAEYMDLAMFLHMRSWSWKRPCPMRPSEVELLRSPICRA
ncbi:unnamed protein product [Durusdinium trenchii]|uniref:Transmembrane protein n=1 Tax=Durusdinium trenchii TaxID=1381693 RepID=A0ABP0LIF3_9DINO